MALEQITAEYNLNISKAKAELDSLIAKLMAAENAAKTTSREASTSIVVDLSRVVKARKSAMDKAVSDTKKSEAVIVGVSKDTTTKIVAEENKREKKHEQTEKKKVTDTKKAEAEIVEASKKSTNKRIADNQSLGNSNRSLIGTLNSVALAIGITFGAQQLLSFGKELLEIDRKSKGVTRAFNNIADAGTLAALRTATGFGVADLQLKQLAVRANQFKIPLETLPTLLKFATIRAAETGQEVDYLVNSIIDGIGRQSPLILDNLGLSAKDVGNEFRKTGDFAVAVGNIIDREMGKSVTAIGDAVSESQKLAATWENIKEQIAPALSNFLTPGLQALSEGITTATNTLGGFQTTTAEISTALQLYGGDIDMVVKAYERFGTVNADVVEKIQRLRDITSTASTEYDTLRNTIAGFTSNTEFANLITELQGKMLGFQQAGKQSTEAYLNLRTSLQLVSDEFIKFGTAINTATTAPIETLESLKAQLKNLQDLFENTDIKAPQFRTLQNEIKALEERIESIVNPVNNGSIAAFEKELSKLQEQLSSTTSIQRMRELEREIYLLTVRIASLKNLNDNTGLEIIDEDVPKNLKDANDAALKFIQSMKLLNDADLKDLNAEIKKAEDALTSLANMVTDELWEEFKQGQDKAKAAQAEFNDTVRGGALTLIADLTNLFGQIGQQQSDAVIRQLEGEKNRAIEHNEIMKGIWQQQLERGEITNEELFNNQVEYTEKINALTQRQAEIRKQQLRKQAIAEKANSSFQIIIGAASGIGKAIGDFGPAAIPFIAAIGAITAAQLAIIAATPIPEFAKGVVDLKGKGTGTSDSIPAKLSKGESVITAKATRENRDALTAMNKGEYESYVKQKYIMPALVKKKEKDAGSFARNIANSMLTGVSDDNTDLLQAIGKNKRVDIRNADAIGKSTAREISKRNYFSNRV